MGTRLHPNYTHPPLPREPLTKEEREWLADLDCWNPPHITLLFLTNLPVFFCWAAVKTLTANQRVDQVFVFYAVNGIGIPLFWYGIGALIDWRLGRVRTRTQR